MPGAHNARGHLPGNPGGRAGALVADEASATSLPASTQALIEAGRRERRHPDRGGLAEADAGGAGGGCSTPSSGGRGILCGAPERGELGARMAIRRRCRAQADPLCHMIGVTPRIMQEGMRATTIQVDELSQRLCARMETARMLTVRTAGGTPSRPPSTPAWSG